MRVQTSSVTPAQACIELAEVFQHPLVEEAQHAKTAHERHLQNQLLNRAERACLTCPMLSECLYRAVVEHDVAGYVAATTPRQRTQIRSSLGLRVPTEEFDSFIGACAGKRQVDPHEVLRQRIQNPHESLESIAQRMGCSLSTVKRHLRRARGEDLPERPRRMQRPTLDAVLATAARVLGRPSLQRKLAA